MSFFSSIVDAPGHVMNGMGEMGQAAGSHFGGLMHGAGDVAGGIGQEWVTGPWTLPTMSLMAPTMRGSMPAKVISVRPLGISPVVRWTA